MTRTLTRRGLLAASAAGLHLSCGRPLAKRYLGWLLVTSAQEKAVTVADLAEFKRVSTIPLGETPGQIMSAGGKVFVTCPEAHLLVEILTDRFGVGHKIQLPGRIVSTTVSEAGTILVATAQPSALVVVDPRKARITGRIQLAGDPSTLDAAGDVVALATERPAQIVRISLKNGTILGRSPLGEPCGAMRFRRDGQSILAGLPHSKQIVSLDAQTGQLLARLPLRFAPGRFCFNADGGQMFVTAVGEDSIAIVSPFQSQIDQTIVGGRMPYGMAVSSTRNMLLISNPPSGDLTILDIETRRLAASVHVGGEPGEVLLTPDEEYALVLSRDSGDVAVVRMTTVLDRAVRTKPLLTMFPMGLSPQSALVMPREA